MGIFFHGYCFDGYNRLLLIKGGTLLFSVCFQDMKFQVSDVIRKNYDYSVVRFNSYIDQCRDMQSL